MDLANISKKLNPMKLLCNNNSPSSIENTYSLQGFTVFCAKYKGDIFLTILMAFLAYGYKIFNNTFSIDTNAIIAVPESLYQSWYALERFGIVWTKKLMGTYWYNNVLASLLVGVFVVCASILWSYLINEPNGQEDKQIIRPALFAPLIVVSPVLAEMVGFLLLGPEIGIALCLVAFSLMLTRNALENKIYYIPAIITATISFTIYLAMVTVFVVGTAIIFLTTTKAVKKYKDQFSFLGNFIGVFVLSYAFYFILNKLAMKAAGVTTDPYISEQSRWGKDPFNTIIFSILSKAKDFVYGEGIFYTKLFFPFACIFVLLYVYLYFKKQVTLLHPIVAVLICLSPLMMSVILGAHSTVRTEMTYTFTLAIIFATVAAYIAKSITKSSIGSVIAILLITVVAFNQASITNRLYYTEAVTYQQDVSTATQIEERLNEVKNGDASADTIVFIGSHAPLRTPGAFTDEQLELVGRSMLNISFSTLHGSNVKAQFFNAALGTKHQSPTYEQIEQAESLSSEMDSWPAKNCIRQLDDGTFVVRLS